VDNRDALGGMKRNTKAKKQRKNIVGEPINFRGLTYAPVNEQGVVLLFGMLAKELGFHVQLVRQGYPDCKAVRSLGNGRYEEVNVEFEFRSGSFKPHLKSEIKSDFIVCWEHNWPQCPPYIEVIELRELIESGQLNPVAGVGTSEHPEERSQSVTYSLQDLLKEHWKDSKDLLAHFEKGLKNVGKYKRRFTKLYVAYDFGGKNRVVEVVPQRKGLKVYLRPKRRYFKSAKLELENCEHIGHWTSGSTRFVLVGIEEIPSAIDVVQQALDITAKQRSKY
jgi:predicted transport protein